MIMPSQIEQDIAETYVLEKSLERPNTDLKKVLICMCVFLMINMCIIILLYNLFERLGISGKLNIKIINFKSQNETLFFIALMVIVFGISLVVSARFIIIGAIKLYQHYAPEHVRRRCLCMPTCSEYGIMVVKKYGVIIGFYKIYIRLFKRCRGNIYTIDYPSLHKKKKNSGLFNNKYDIYIDYRRR